MDQAVIKFSSEDCGICHKCLFYDQKVSEELVCNLLNVKNARYGYHLST